MAFNIVKILGSVAAKLQDGSGNAITSATRGSEQAISVQVVDGSGGQVTTFGADPVGIKDSASTTIDPATVEFQREIIKTVRALGKAHGMEVGVEIRNDKAVDVALSSANITSIQGTASIHPETLAMLDSVHRSRMSRQV